MAIFIVLKSWPAYYYSKIKLNYYKNSSNEFYKNKIKYSKNCLEPNKLGIQGKSFCYSGPHFYKVLFIWDPLFSRADPVFWAKINSFSYLFFAACFFSHGILILWKISLFCGDLDWKKVRFPLNGMWFKHDFLREPRSRED